MYIYLHIYLYIVYIYIKIYTFIFSLSNTKLANTKELQKLSETVPFLLNSDFRLLFSPLGSPQVSPEGLGAEWLGWRSPPFLTLSCSSLWLCVLGLLMASSLDEFCCT